MTRIRAYADDPVKARIYNSFRNIRQCAYNPNNICYKRAQAAGLELECYWNTLEEFYQYVVKHLGPPPFPRARVIRKNQNRSWAPGNIEWNTHKSQGQRYRTCHMIRYQGRTLSLKEWSEQLDLSVHTIYGRWARGVRKPSLLLSKEKIGV